MIVAALLLAILSYGFIDPNFPILHNPLEILVYRHMPIAAVIYVLLLLVLFFCYHFLRFSQKKIPPWFPALVLILLISYPAFSYDIFNYIATAKVTFFYKENPYIVMPIEIPNEPMLAFTRASNKLALYGPTWIILTSFPHLLGMGNMLATVLSFKLFVAAFYGAFVYLIYRKTKRWDQTLFFALNPLVLIEILVSGHNDIVMMTLAIAGLLLWRRAKALHKAAGLILFTSSILVKGATLVLVPLLLTTSWNWERVARAGCLLMFGVFLLTPLREELYPWYAVWWLAFAAFLPIKKKSFIHSFSFWLSLGLMLRYVPWIATRQYGGMMPLYRSILTIAPIGLYLLYDRLKKA
jgi:hypothetical protein